jgi:hypothetical protein
MGGLDLKTSSLSQKNSNLNHKKNSKVMLPYSKCGGSG